MKGGCVILKRKKKKKRKIKKKKKIKGRKEWKNGDKKRKS